MARLRSISYTKAVVICHGKSELFITRHIYSNLHLPVKVHARDKGESSIQITSLKDELSTTYFKNISVFSDHFGVEKEKNKLKNFKLFIIMDTDDCSEIQKEEFINGKMFSDLWLHEYVVPVFNSPDLEKVLLKCELIRPIKKYEKGEYYEKIFPVNHNGKFNEGTINDIRNFNAKLKNAGTSSNLSEMIEYFLGLVDIKK